MHVCWVHLSWRRYLFHSTRHTLLPAQDGVWDLHLQAPHVISTQRYVVVMLSVCEFWYFVSLVTATYIRLFLSILSLLSHLSVRSLCVLVLSSVETVRICVLYRWEQLNKLDVHGSMHHSTIHKERSNKMEQCIDFYYSIFIWSSTCFGRHTAHHQGPKTALAASGFSYLEGCWTCSWWTLSGTTSTNYTYKQPSTYEKPEAASAVLGPWWWAVCRPKHFELHINME
jgi:hypothetical protein